MSEEANDGHGDMKVKKNALKDVKAIRKQVNILLECNLFLEKLILMQLIMTITNPR